MSRLLPATSLLSRGRVGLIIAIAIGVLVGLTLLPASHAVSGIPEAQVDGCSVTLPESADYKYVQFGQDLDPGTYDLVPHYGVFTVDIFAADATADDSAIDHIVVPVPLDCAITVTAQCEDVTFTTALDDGWWSVLSLKYGAVGDLTETAAFDGTDTITIPFDHDPLAYELVDVELQTSTSGTISPNCPVAEEPIDTTPPPTDEEAAPTSKDEAPEPDDETPVPTVAPSSGM